VTLRVLVADDRAPFRRAARSVLRASAGFEFVGEASSGEEAVALAGSLRPDLVLMDILMAGIGGIEATRRIAAARPGTVTVLLSTYRAEDLPAEARSCGAAAYVHKADFEAGLLRSIYASRSAR
jgi:two-component system, NarL family, invasion response regulator UvrY